MAQDIPIKNLDELHKAIETYKQQEWLDDLFDEIEDTSLQTVTAQTMDLGNCGAKYYVGKCEPIDFENECIKSCSDEPMGDGECCYIPRNDSGTDDETTSQA